jgi:predicted nucleic acid-binding protein
MPERRVVVDASALAGLVLPDEGGNGLAAILAEAAPVAPGLLWAEIRNLLLMAERRGRIAPGTPERALAILDGLGIAYDAGPASDRTLQLARRHGLTVCDALYLELALRLGLALATADRALVRAAAAEGVERV